MTRIASTMTLGVVYTLVAISVARAAPQDAVADAVLGQADFTSKTANEGLTPTAASINECRGLTVDRASGRLWVCDTGNNRVLSWPSASAFINHASADTVLGQANFVSVDANRGAANPTAKTLSGPRTVAVDSAGRVYVADSGNKRILRYDPPIAASDQAAVQVFGQAGDFTTANQASAAAASADNLGNPDGIAVDSAGNLYLADLFLHRVLIYNTPATTDTTADVVIGQVNLTTAQRNQNDGTPTPAANTLNNPEGVAIDGSNNLYVVDQGNNRVLFFPAPLTTNKSATRVFGQPDFATDTAGTTAAKFTVPVAAGVDPVTGDLFVADSINNRILQFADPISDPTADVVYGQANFTSGTANPGGVSASTLSDVGGVTFDAAGNMYAGDRLNHRVLRYNTNPDTDGDGVPNTTDNCPNTANADQADADSDGVGNVCDSTPGTMSPTTCGLGCGGGTAPLLPLMVAQAIMIRQRARAGNKTRR